MTDAFEYDVALSFASEDKSIAEEFAKLLSRTNITVFLDEYTSSDVWGDNTVDHLVNLFARKARYCLLLISEHYPLKHWTEVDRTHAQERALRDASAYILPVQLDNSEVPGIMETKGNRDLRQHSVADIVEWLDEKLRESARRSGPPPQSHDLRSGNVPSTHSKTDNK